MFTEIVLEQMLAIPIFKTIKPTPSHQVPLYPHWNLNAKATNLPNIFLVNDHRVE